jgi:hypothetical protein
MVTTTPTGATTTTAATSSTSAAAQAAAQQAAVFSMNRAYLKNTVRRKAICPPSSGMGFNQNYSLGSTLSFNAPTANNAFLEGFYVYLTLHVDIATGTSATYAATAARELGLIREIDVLYNGTLCKFSPYVLPTYRMLQGDLQPRWPNGVIAGQANTQMNAYLSQGPLPVTPGSTNNLVNIEYYVPLNWLHPQDVRGLLPIDGNSTTAQITVQCASALLGNDASQNCWYQSGGTAGTGAVSLTAGAIQTVQLIAAYRDGTTMSSTSSLPISLANQGTAQLQQDVTLTSITAGQIYRQKLVTLQQHYYVICTVIDGQQASQYALNSNITYLELSTDSTGSNAFWKVGTGTNLSVNEWFNEMRFTLGQDLDPGMFVPVCAPIYGEADESNLNGTAILNCDPTKGGYSDIHYGISFNSLAATLAGVTPRVETHVLYVNPTGLVVNTA